MDGARCTAPCAAHLKHTATHPVVANPVLIAVGEEGELVIHEGQGVGAAARWAGGGSPGDERCTCGKGAGADAWAGKRSHAREARLPAVGCAAARGVRAGVVETGESAHQAPVALLALRMSLVATDSRRRTPTTPLARPNPPLIRLSATRCWLAEVSP